MLYFAMCPRNTPTSCYFERSCCRTWTVLYSRRRSETQVTQSNPKFWKFHHIPFPETFFFHRQGMETIKSRFLSYFNWRSLPILLYWGNIGLNYALKTIRVTVNHVEPLGGDLALSLRHSLAQCMNHESQKFTEWDWNSHRIMINNRLCAL